MVAHANKGKNRGIISTSWRDECRATGNSGTLEALREGVATVTPGTNAL